MTLLLVCVAGAMGCVVRYTFEYLVRRNHPTSRPWATVAANAITTLDTPENIAKAETAIASVVSTTGPLPCRHLLHSDKAEAVIEAALA